MNWIELTQKAQLDMLIEKSAIMHQVIFKHSTRCSTSAMILNRIERSEIPASADFYFLDLIRNRDISDSIAERFHVYHESPQILLIKNGQCVYDESHLSIRMEELIEQF